MNCGMAVQEKLSKLAAMSSDSNRSANQWRSRFRGRSHQEAHANASQTPAKIPHLPGVCRDSARLIDDAGDLAEMLEHLRESGSFAFDTEFIGEMTYTPHLCLIQVATATRIALIDPLSSLDLGGFWQLICDEAIEKIVHAGLQDVEPAARLLGKSPQNVWDTQIAAGFMRLAYPVSLSKLVDQLLGVRLPKGLTFSNWDNRPLSSMQLRYGADDVRYLPAVRAAQFEALHSAGTLGWMRSECAEAVRMERFVFDANQELSRFRGATGLEKKPLAVLRQLIRWRSAEAQQRDLPVRALLRDEWMMEMARKQPKTIEQLGRVHGIARPVLQDDGDAILAAIALGLSEDGSDLPQLEVIEETPASRFTADSLFGLVQSLGAAVGIDPALLINRQQVSVLAQHLEEPDAAAVPLMRGWRLEAVGRHLLEILKRKRTCQLGWERGGLFLQS